VESSNYDLGGVCVDSNFDSEVDFQRQLFHGYYCGLDPSSPYYYFCDCGGFDLASGIGTIKCATLDSCTDVSNNYCFSVTYEITYNAADYFGTYCYDFSVPDNHIICYSYYSLGGCSISFNDETWNSCIVDQYGFYDFDCLNTALKQSGSQSEGDFLVYTIFELGDCVEETSCGKESSSKSEKKSSSKSEKPGDEKYPMCVQHLDDKDKKEDHFHERCRELDLSELKEDEKFFACCDCPELLLVGKGKEGKKGSKKRGLLSSSAGSKDSKGDSKAAHHVFLRDE
jgi:hypothetical protein